MIRTTFCVLDASATTDAAQRTITTEEYVVVRTASGDWALIPVSAIRTVEFTMPLGTLATIAGQTTLAMDEGTEDRDLLSALDQAPDAGIVLLAGGTVTGVVVPDAAEPTVTGLDGIIDRVTSPAPQPTPPQGRKKPRRPRPRTTSKAMPEAVPEVGFESAGGDSDAEAESSDLVLEATDGDGDTVAAERNGAEGRFVSAQVFALENGQRGLERRQSFRSGAAHQADVWIGPKDVEAIQTEDTVDESVFDDDEDSHHLLILFEAPDGTSAIQPVDLPPRSGKSTLATFEFEVADDATDVACKILVLYKNRGIHLAHLIGPSLAGVVDGEAPGGRITLESDPPLRPLTTMSEFDLAFTTDGHHLRITDTATDESRTVSLAGIDGAVGTLRDELRRKAVLVANQLTGFEEGPGLTLLHNLAAQGRLLYMALAGAHGAVTKADLARISVVSQSPSDWIPIEFVYDRELPDGSAKLCSKFKAAAEAGAIACDGCEADGQPSTAICPFGFWGLSKVIERTIFRSEPTSTAAGALSANPSDPGSNLDTLPQFGSVILAASDKVDSETDESEVDATKDHLTGLGLTVAKVDTWSDWVDHIESAKPSLLVALPHSEQVDNIITLQIGDGSDPLRRTHLKAKHVGDQDREPGPIILLLGCDTTAPKIGFHDFVSGFRNLHASVVVGTVATVLGRQAAPVARELVSALVANDGNSETVGEAMRAVKSRLVAADNPMALTLTAYGDADWKLP
jgi:hypothetical protein